MKQSYLDEVGSFVKSKSAKRQIRAELESHIADKTDYYIEIGYSPAQAEQKAIDDMGDPELAAVSLNALHSVKWYMVPLNIITLAFMLILLVFSAQSYYFDYGSALNDISHSIAKDTVSFVLFAAVSLILYFSYKKRNRHSAASLLILFYVIGIVGISGELIFGKPWSVKSAQALFEPFWYALITLFSKGPVGYCDSVFTPSPFTASARFVYQLFAWATLVFFTVWGVITCVKVRRSEACKPAKGLDNTNKVFAIITKVVCLLTAVIMLAGSIFASKDSDVSKIKSMEMIDFVLEYKTNDNEEDILSRAKSAGFEFENTANENDADNGLKLFTYYSGNCGITYFTNSDAAGLSYYVNNYASPAVVDGQSIEVGETAFDSLQINKTTLDEFRQDGDFYKAALVNANSDGTIQFQYTIRGSDNRYVLEFENNVLINKTIPNFNGGKANEEPTLPEPSSTVFNLLN